jgi:hypothetical protein
MGGVREQETGQAAVPSDFAPLATIASGMPQYKGSPATVTK